jgi:transposase
MGRHRVFSEEYKQQAVRLVIEQGIGVKQAAQDLGLGKSTLDKWVRSARENGNNINMVTEHERDELKRLRKENQQLRLERDILKKATAFFAKSST